jgi:hypothetical protein
MLVVAVGCKGKGEAPAPSGSTSATPAASASQSAEVSVKIPPIERLIPKQAFDVAGTRVTLQLCRLDASAPAIESSEQSDATAPLAAAPDGTIWVIDHQKKLRHYVNRSATGCELVLDRAFADGGVLDLKDAEGRSSFRSVAVDGKGVVYVTGNNKTKMLAGGKLVDHCQGYFRAQPTSKLALLDGDRLLEGDTCDGKSISFAKGFDPSAPEYARPRAIGLIDDEILVGGVDMEGKKEISKVGVHRADGSQRLKLGKAKGDEAMWGPDAAIKCGDDLCVFTDSLGAVSLHRFTRAGAFVSKLAMKVDGLQKAGVAGTGGDTLWIHGAVSGTGPKGKYGSGSAAVILLLRGLTAKPSPPAALGDEPTPASSIGPIRGVLRGKPLVALKVDIEFRSGGWSLEVLNASGSSIGTTLVAAPTVGAISFADASTKTFGHAYLTSEENKGTSLDSVGYARHRIEITKWDVPPYDPAKKSNQSAGYASGRLYIATPSTAKLTDPDSSICAGEFEDAVVTYRDDPSAPKR